MMLNDIVTNKNSSSEIKKNVLDNRSTTPNPKYYEPLEQDILYERKNSKKNLWLWLLLMVLVVGGGVYVWHKYSKANVLIITQKAPYAFTNTPFTGVRNNSDTQDSIPFEVMVVDDTYKQTLTYGTKNIATKKARGSIVVQNAASSSKISLKKGSVAISATGMHYTVLNTTNIPGYTKKGTTINPGSTEVVIEAEKAGAEYNTSSTSFTFPTYKSKSNLLTAKTTGLGIVGGANGNMYTMTDEEATKTIESIQESAKNKIFIKANAEIPPGYRIYKDAVVYKNDSLSGIQESQTAVKDIIQNTTLVAYLFRERDIENYIFTHSDHELQDPSYTVTNIDDVNIKLVSTPADPKGATSLALQITGTGIIDWSVDQDAVKKALVGIHKKDVGNIFAEFKTIDTANVTTNPWFEAYLPKDKNRINVDIQK